MNNISHPDIKSFMAAWAKRPEFVLLVALVLLVVVTTIRDNTFINMLNVSSMLNYASFTGIVSIGLVMLLVSGHLDMSIGAVTGLMSILLATFVLEFSFPPFLAFVSILLIGMGIGFFNGFMIVKMKINAFILTLATMFTCRGLIQVISDGRSIIGLPAELVAPAYIRPLGLPLNVYVFLILGIAGWFLLQKTAFGKSIFVIGNNETIAITSGINKQRVSMLLYVITGALCAVSGYFLTVQYRMANITGGVNWEFVVTSACMLGGASMYGGKGTVFGGMLGIMFMTALLYSLQAFRVPGGYQVLITGLVLIISVLIDVTRSKKLSA